MRALERQLESAVPFYRGRGGFESWPVIDKAVLTAGFAEMNVAGITLDQVRAALADGETAPGGYAVGHSTGTSGNRGYYLISDAERYVWLGTLLAKALPDALWRRHRVALALPGFSSLYQSASSGSRIQLGLFDLGEGIDAWTDRLAAFAPDTIVAPPRVLRLLAEAGRLDARHVFSGAEVLDPLDRAVIERATGVRVREIYMATEGLFGVACRHGTLHLAEDAVRFDWEAVPGSALVAPVVTDFTRRTQAMARYRMNDLLLFSKRPCACGSALQAVARVEGRADDMAWFSGADQKLLPVTPDVLRNAVVDADPRIDDFRIEQTGASTLTVRLPAHLPAEADEAVRRSLMRLAERLRLAPLAIVVERGITPPLGRKLRRVTRSWRESFIHL